MKARVCLLLFLAAMLPPLLAGCQRLNDERTFTIPPLAIQLIEYSEPRYQQKVTIHISSPGAPVTAYLVPAKDKDEAQKQMDNNKAPAAPLAGKEKAEEITLEATVPAKTAFVLMVRADKKKAEVHIKTTGR
ncbi:MAG TPA: hypothetical protein VMG10_05910 [Gemmataceae bacterium]|nr:hypothetical protein [Gemmataceae bacterium]